MSRIGKKPVSVPAGVTASLEGQTVKAKGPKGELSLHRSRAHFGRAQGRGRQGRPEGRNQAARSQWGMSRTMVSNIFAGVTQGFQKRLEINGVGYKAAIAGKVVKLSLGYSHDVDYPIPEGITVVATKPTELVISGIDKQKVGQVAAEIREYRGPEPYKGKGVKYAGEFIFRKEGKKK